MPRSNGIGRRTRHHRLADRHRCSCSSAVPARSSAP